VKEMMTRFLFDWGKAWRTSTDLVRHEQAQVKGRGVPRVASLDASRE